MKDFASGHDNIALIRSGQEWIEAGEEERSLYLDEIQPTVEAPARGSTFVRGCRTPLRKASLRP